MKTDDFKQFINDDKGQDDGEIMCCIGIFLLILSLAFPPAAVLLVIFVVIVVMIMLIGSLLTIMES